MVVIFIAVFSAPVFAQGYPVIDIANLMQAINTLYATYDQITAAIEQVQNTYQQLQKQIEMVQNMDWDKVGEKIGDMDVTSVDGILNLRHQIKDVTKMVNANINLINNVQDTLTKRTVSFGGKR
jgi:conjugal transfer/entry exclusion protein